MGGGVRAFVGVVVLSLMEALAATPAGGEPPATIDLSGEVVGAGAGATAIYRLTAQAGDDGASFGFDA
jgi:hypothetical protein